MKNNAQRLRAQSTLEYAVIIACIAGALLSMQVYIKRAIQGKLRTAADDIGQQYDPENTTTATGGMVTKLTSDTTTEVETTIEIDPATNDNISKITTTITINSQEEEVDGTETVGAL